MWKSKEEIVETFLDHLDSVAMSGCGHETSGQEILSIMHQTVEDFESGEESLPFSVVVRTI